MDKEFITKYVDAIVADDKDTIIKMGEELPKEKEGSQEAAKAILAELEVRGGTNETEDKNIKEGIEILKTVLAAFAAEKDSSGEESKEDTQQEVNTDAEDTESKDDTTTDEAEDNTEAKSDGNDPAEELQEDQAKEEK